jgi:cation diffusion facilitator family transporter
MGLNTLLACGKLAAGILGNSHALVADAVESLADVFSSIIVWRGLVIAAAPADAEHPYGHGKAEPIAAALVSTILLFAATGIVIQAVHEIYLPKGGPKAFTLFVLVAVVVVKEGLFRFVSREAHAVDSSAVQADAWHHRSDAITSIAAAMGITIALIGGKGYESADDIAAIVAAGIIAWNGWRLLRPALNELMDTAPGTGLREEFRREAETIQGVAAVEKCVVRKMGYQYFVDMHVEVDPRMSVQEAHDIAHRVKDHIKGFFPSVRDVLVHIEPSRSSLKKPGFTPNDVE